MVVRGRNEVAEACRRGPFDLIVIGGGINGAGILRDASLRGFKAILFEQNDFASGTSSKSSKLIHGGLRYLETYDFKLVFEATHERRLLLKLAPDLIKPLSFLFPVYKGDRRKLFEVAAGVWLYELLASFHGIRKPEIRFRERTLEIAPPLRADRLVGSALYYDAVTDDTQLTLANLRSAWKKGAFTLNHARISRLLQESEKIVGVEVMDEITGQTLNVRSRWVVNSTGPWSDRFLKSNLDTAKPRLRLTKGVHLVLPSEKIPIAHACVMLAPTDGRVTFLIPWNGVLLLGTTDTDFTGDPTDVRTSQEDVTYLLKVANYYFPDARLTSNDVISTFAGLRPLLDDQQKHPSSVSREHTIFTERDGLVSLAGGKLTTYRKMSSEVVDHLIRHTSEWKNRPRKSPTASEPLFSEFSTLSFREKIERSIQEEMACTLSDVLCFRTGSVHLEKDHGRSRIEEVSSLLRDQLALSERELKDQVKVLEEVIERAESGLKV
jgi:glycerol-3-phosphate dehydrogenase